MKTLAIMAIPLTQGLFALIDGDDYKEISRHKWYVLKVKNTYYAIRNVGKRPNRHTILMHRQILNAQEGKVIDHLNGSGLDNRKQNIRLCTISQNSYNQQGQIGRSSKFKGVCHHKQSNKWRATIGFNRKVIELGHFNNEIDAAKAYDKKAKELFGEFARTNFMKGEICKKA